MSDEPFPRSEIVLYQTEDGRTHIQCRLEGELRREATIRKFRIVRKEGGRQVARDVEHYNLEAILAVGYRVRSHRGTQFRQWATARLSEYLVKGFTMDDERLKNPPGHGQKDYFDEQLAHSRHPVLRTASSPSCGPCNARQ